ncbi:MAG: hypothetical protein J0H67_15290 [Rhodospirillales bacterium]|nr:hypothetical protein [Rhodospirillales bacterium]
MSGSTTLPPGIMLRDLMLSFHHSRRLIYLLVACVMVGSVAIALQIEPSYQAKSSLLVLMGTEHTYRPAAGEQFMNSGGADKEIVLRTEADILSSDDLHRAVIKQVGVDKLYPKMLEPPGEFTQLVDEGKAYVGELLGMPHLAKGAGDADPISRALVKFNANLGVGVDRKSSVIGLSFTHTDPKIAAEVLRILEDQYFALRTKLFNDVQAPIVLRQQQEVGAQLAAADDALAKFKQEHDISSYTERRAIVMKQQGELETELTKLESRAAEQQARVAELDKQLAVATGGRADAAAALQAMVNAYQKRQQDATTTYRGSPAYDEARNQAMARQTDVASLKAKHAFEIQTERNKADSDLRAAVAGRDAVRTQLAALKQQIDRLDGEETTLHQLERNRTVLEDNYKSVSKILGDRTVIENVEASRESSVRVIEPPRPPAMPRPLRRLIVIGGALLSVILAVGVTLMSHFFRSIYLRPEALELDTGLPVLASVPETRALARSAILIGPN